MRRWASATGTCGSETAGDRRAETRLGWTKETKVLGGVRFTVLTDDDTLRRRIVDSARLLNGSDGSGCTPDHALAQHPEGRPVAADGLGSVGTVRSVTVCRYRLRTPSAARNQADSLGSRWLATG
jgi:hypothetical protein